MERFGTILEDGSINWLSVEDLIEINRRLILDQTPHEPIGVISQGNLESSQASPAMHKYYAQTDDVFVLASVLIESLIKNHCFANANKRTAVMAGFMFLRLNGYRMPPVDKYEATEISVGIATGDYSREDLENWLYQHSEDFDARELCKD